VKIKPKPNIRDQNCIPTIINTKSSSATLGEKKEKKNKNKNKNKTKRTKN